MLTSKAKYGLRAMIDLARQGVALSGAPQMIAEIAERQQIPRRFLENILMELRRHGLVVSHRGRNGGYTLAKNPADIAFIDIIRVIDGPIALAPCVSLTQYRRCDDCIDDEKECALRHTLMAAREATRKVLEDTSLLDAATEK